MTTANPLLPGAMRDIDMSRTKAQRAKAKRLLQRPAGKLEPIDLAMRNAPSWMTQAYSNNRYVVMINDNACIKGITAIKVMVRCVWSETMPQ